MGAEFSKWQLVRNIVEQSTDSSEAEQAVVEVLTSLVEDAFIPTNMASEVVYVDDVLDALASSYCVQFSEDGEDG